AVVTFIRGAAENGAKPVVCFRIGGISSHMVRQSGVPADGVRRGNGTERQVVERINVVVRKVTLESDGELAKVVFAGGVVGGGFCLRKAGKKHRCEDCDGGNND